MHPVEKTASVHWEGQGREGQGAISTQSAALAAVPGITLDAQLIRA